MSALLRHLEAAREALLDGRPTACAEALAAFEATFAAAPPEPAEATRCRARLAALGGLTQAALAGLADARACIEGAVAGAGRLDTYARDGRREERRVQPGREHRF